ncbi:hypothetical protein DPMN_182160 [Dreissena polymorpha]|uniref:Uncharacterized protein n=1 Tax=Dreissena polymorpha TaxID=45954 RepID=A0A9D4I2B8_DREPO|nr:hypothetical protein DPMN_182160 [Dreissena polymorpha]
MSMRLLSRVSGTCKVRPGSGCWRPPFALLVTLTGSVISSASDPISGCVPSFSWQEQDEEFRNSQKS